MSSSEKRPPKSSDETLDQSWAEPGIRDALRTVTHSLEGIREVLVRSDGLHTSYKAAAGERAAMVSELIKEREKLQAEVIRLQRRAQALEKRAQDAERRATRGEERIVKIQERLRKAQILRGRAVKRLREVRDERDGLAARRSVRAALRLADATAIFRPSNRRDLGSSEK